MLVLQPGRPPILSGRFEIVGTIDASGATRQYLAWDEQEEVWVNIRMPSFKAARDSFQRTRFEREIRTHRKLQHPNVLQVIVADAAHPRFPWAAMQVAEGGSIADWMSQNGVLPAYLAIDVMADVCNGLSAAHKAKVSHGAIRPQQVLLNRNGKCVVAGLIGGGERGDVQADVRGAGAMLYTLLTGERWDDKRPAAQLGQLPPVIAKVVEKARKGRGGYADLNTFSRELEAAVLSLPMPDGTVPPLVSPDMLLPDDPAVLWDDASEFPDLEHIAKGLEDPEYAPPAEAFEGPDEETVASASPGASAFGGTAPTASGASGPAPVPYQMSRGNKGADFKPETYQRGDKPLYEDPPDESSKDWKNWDPSEDMVVQEVVAEEDKPLVTEALLVKLIVGAALFLAITVVGAVGYGAKQVGEARAETDRAASALVEHIRGESELVYAMGSAGADRKTLEDAYFVYNEARNDTARVRAALAFARLLNEQARANKLDAVSQGGSVTELTQRLDDITRLNGELMAKRGEWDRRASGFPGVLSVVLGIQIAPPY